MRAHGLVVALFTSLVVPTLHAQAPGPVSDDSIYALFVDPGDYRGHDVVVLLEDGVTRIEADGRSSYTLRQVAQVLTTEGTEEWGEYAFGYYPSRQTFRLNWLRIVRKDGTVVSDGPEHQQESSPAVEQGAPVYSDRKILQMTAAGVAPGTIVDYSYTIETFAPRLPGDVWDRWQVNGLTPVLRSRFVIDTPEAMRLKVREENVAFAATERIDNGRRIRIWATENVPGVEVQSYLGFPNKVVTAIEMSADMTWDQIGAWYHPLIRDRYVLAPEIEAAHDAELAAARTFHDSLRATYRWVAQDFRYVSLSLGDGAYQPRSPIEVFQSGFGDCKDKATLFVSLVRRMGGRAYPVLVHSEGDVDSVAPSLSQFDHMIAAVDLDGEFEYFDLTTDLTPYGEIPASLQGEVGVILLDGLGTEVVVLPADPPGYNVYEQVVTGALGRDNRFVGSVTVTATGTEQYFMREDFAEIDQVDADAKDELLREYAHSVVWQGAMVDSSEIFEGRDLTAPARIKIWFSASSLLGQVGGKYTLHMPVMNFTDKTVLSELEAEGKRRFPIDVASVNSPSVYRSRFEVELPEGWKAQVPNDVSTEGPFGYYMGNYRQIGRTVTVTREMGGLRGLLPPDSIGALTAWFTAVNVDDNRSLILDRSGTPGLIASGESESVGRLPEILLLPEDLGDGASVTDEGPAAGGGAFDMSSSVTVESYSRSFAASQMVFTVGSSPLVFLELSAGTYNTNTEAIKNLRMLGLMDLSAFFGVYLQEAGLEQGSIGEVRTVDFSGVSDQAAAWTVEVTTPFAPLTLAIAILTRGRVSVAGVAVGTQGLQGSDLATVFALMDERIQADPGYVNDLPQEDWVTAEIEPFAAADSAGGLPLADVPLGADDFPGSMSEGWTFTRAGGALTYTATLSGRAFTFSTQSAEAVSVEMEVAAFDDDAHALQHLLRTERQDIAGFLLDRMADEPEMVAAVVEGDSSAMHTLEPPGIANHSIARVVRLRGAISMDLDVVQFARGRFVTTVSAWREPGTSMPDDANAIARRMDGNLVRVVPEVAGATLDPAVLDRVREVVLAEEVVDSLVEARDFEAAFNAIDGADLDRAPVQFGSPTWNNTCWYASLYGHAERAMPACEAAVASDTTNLSYLDSRALARALAGDLDGAIADFAYIVDRAGEGAFLEVRAGWLEMLEAGENPFTEEELERLKGSETGVPVP